MFFTVLLPTADHTKVLLSFSRQQHAPLSSKDPTTGSTKDVYYLYLCIWAANPNRVYTSKFYSIRHIVKSRDDKQLQIKQTSLIQFLKHIIKSRYSLSYSHHISPPTKHPTTWDTKYLLLLQYTASSHWYLEKLDCPPM
jgi:hypothetical protein